MCIPRKCEWQVKNSMLYHWKALHTYYLSCFAESWHYSWKEKKKPFNRLFRYACINTLVGFRDARRVALFPNSGVPLTDVVDTKIIKGFCQDNRVPLYMIPSLTFIFFSIRSTCWPNISITSSPCSRRKSSSSGTVVSCCTSCEECNQIAQLFLFWQYSVNNTLVCQYSWPFWHSVEHIGLALLQKKLLNRIHVCTCL